MNTAIALLAWLALCVFLQGSAKVKASLTPLLALCITMLYFSLAGVLQVLWPAGLLFYLLAFGLCGFTLVKQGVKTLHNMLTPGFLVFAVGCVLLLAHFAIKTPMFSEWDEFSTWGTAAKLLKLNNSLYTTAEMGWVWTTTQSPALPLLAYFAQFFGSGFAAWKVYWAYDALTLAVCAALLAPYTLKDWKKALPVGLLALLTPYFFSVFYRQVHLNKAYLTAYADIASGLLLGGALVLYYTLARQGQPKVARLWQAALPLAALALVKENFYPVVLVAMALLVLDAVLFAKPKGKALLKKAGIAAAAVAAALLPYIMWQAHAGWANRQNAVTGGQQTSMDALTAALTALRQLLGMQPQSQRFSEVLQLMGPTFVNKRVSMVGGGLATCLFIAALFACAFALQQNKTLRLRIALAFGVLAAGFVAYQFVLLASYSFIFSTSLETGLFEYDRYVSGYYTALFLLGVFFLAQAARQKQPEAEKAAPKHRWAVPCLAIAAGLLVCYHAVFTGKINLEAASPKWTLLYWAGWLALAVLPVALALLAKGRARLAAQSGVLAVGIAVALLFVTLVPPGLSALDYSTRAYHQQQMLEQNAQAAAEYLQPGERIFFVCQNGTGLQWFQYSYYFLPYILDYSITGGVSILPPGTPGANPEKAKTLEGLQQYLQQNNCTTIFVVALDDVFIETYGALFTDGLQSFTGQPVLYLGNGQGAYAPVQ